MRTLVLGLFFACAYLPLRAQIPVEMLAGHEQIQHEFFFFKDLDTTHTWNLFSQARFAVDYDNPDRNTAFISSQVTYNLTRSWGISGGAIYADKEADPILALSYTYFNKKGDLFFNLFPTWIIKEQSEFELFGIGAYTPRINNNWNGFSQVIFGTILNNRWNEHLLSYQQFRLGLDWVGKFQFGIGLDQQFSSLEGSTEYTYNLGPFIRKEL